MLVISSTCFRTVRAFSHSFSSSSCCLSIFNFKPLFLFKPKEKKGFKKTGGFKRLFRTGFNQKKEGFSIGKESVCEIFCLG